MQLGLHIEPRRVWTLCLTEPLCDNDERSDRQTETLRLTIVKLEFKNFSVRQGNYILILSQFMISYSVKYFFRSSALRNATRSLKDTYSNFSQKK